MKLYTRRGDSGATDLFGGQRVAKDDLRVQAYGTVDELNAELGLCLATSGSLPGAIAEPLKTIQSRLFEIGADLATPEFVVDEHGVSKPNPRVVPRVDDNHVKELEGWIDAASSAVPAMTCFILPGGTELSARLHVARTVCRRAERACVTLAEREPVSEQVIMYLNRLSDLLFALARQANHEAGVADVPWVKPGSS
ncbi:MAG: cob(I)yrinic acid a,c-diamide adenosyltransferase [Planctomycetota bacterium]